MRCDIVALSHLLYWCHLLVHAVLTLWDLSGIPGVVEDEVAVGLLCLGKLDGWVFYYQGMLDGVLETHSKVLGLF